MVKEHFKELLQLLGFLCIMYIGVKVLTFLGGL